MSKSTEDTRHKFFEMITDMTSSIEKMSEIILDSFKLFERFLVVAEEQSFSIKQDEYQEIKSRMKGNYRAVRAISESLETMSVRIIALQAPLGKNLRIILSSFKMTYDLERISRYIYTAFRAFGRITPDNQDYFKEVVATLEQAFNAGKKLLGNFIQVYTLKLTAGAEFEYHDIVDQSIHLDDEIDELYKTHTKAVITAANNGKIQADNAHFLLAGIRSLERLGDHSCNLIERAIYMQTGDRIEIR